jgi:hypothetical protein
MSKQQVAADYIRAEIHVTSYVKSIISLKTSLKIGRPLKTLVSGLIRLLLLLSPPCRSFARSTFLGFESFRQSSCVRLLDKS